MILQPYIEHIILKGVKVARVGSSIKLHGHYFSQSILIKINDFETISNFMFIDSNNVEFTLARPSSVEYGGQNILVKVYFQMIHLQMSVKLC